MNNDCFISENRSRVAKMVNKSKHLKGCLKLCVRVYVCKVTTFFCYYAEGP